MLHRPTRHLLAACALALFTTGLVAAPALAHGGGIDSNGGHWCRKNCNPDTYHCHQAGCIDKDGDYGSRTSPSTQTNTAPSPPRDTTPPSAPQLTDGDVVGDAYTVTVSGESGSRLTVTSDGRQLLSQPIDGPTDVTIPLPSDGEYALVFALVDSAGNTSTTITRRITVDTTAPAQPAPTFTPGTTTDPRSVLRFTVDEALRWTVTGLGHDGAPLSASGAAAAGSTVEVERLLAPGPQTLRISLKDATGNVTDHDIEVDVDVPPHGPVRVDVSGAVNDGTRTLTIAGPPFGSAEVSVRDEDGEVVREAQAELDDGGRAEVALDGLADGSLRVHVTSYDYAGRLTAPVDALALTVDRTAPTLALDGAGGTYSFTGDDPEAVVMLSTAALDDEVDVSDGVIDALALGLPVGEHTITLTAVDAAGNASTETLVLVREADLSPGAALLTLLTLGGGVAGGAALIRRSVRSGRSTTTNDLGALPPPQASSSIAQLPPPSVPSTLAPPAPDPSARALPPPD